MRGNPPKAFGGSARRPNRLDVGDVDDETVTVKDVVAHPIHGNPRRPVRADERLVSLEPLDLALRVVNGDENTGSEHEVSPWSVAVGQE